MSRRERGGTQEEIPKPVLERRPLLQHSKKRGRHPLNRGMAGSLKRWWHRLKL